MDFSEVRNELRQLAEAVQATLSAIVRCENCGLPATCFGVYEVPTDPISFACDSCCGHGNEDGWCKPLAEFQTWLAEVEADRLRLQQEIAESQRKRAEDSGIIGRLMTERAIRTERLADAEATITTLRAQIQPLSQAIDKLKVIRAKVDAGYLDGVRDDDEVEAVGDVLQAVKALVNAS